MALEDLGPQYNRLQDYLLARKQIDLSHDLEIIWQEAGKCRMCVVDLEQKLQEFQHPLEGHGDIADIPPDPASE